MNHSHLFIQENSTGSLHQVLTKNGIVLGIWVPLLASTLCRALIPNTAHSWSWEFGSHAWLLPRKGPSFPEQLLLGPGNSGPILSSSLMGPSFPEQPLLVGPYHTHQGVCLCVITDIFKVLKDYQ
jgi:hypothetical protein